MTTKTGGGGVITIKGGDGGPGGDGGVITIKGGDGGSKGGDLVTSQ